MIRRLGIIPGTVEAAAVVGMIHAGDYTKRPVGWLDLPADPAVSLAPFRRALAAERVYATAIIDFEVVLPPCHEQGTTLCGASMRCLAPELTLQRLLLVVAQTTDGRLWVGRDYEEAQTAWIADVYDELVCFLAECERRKGAGRFSGNAPSGRVGWTDPNGGG